MASRSDNPRALIRYALVGAAITTGVAWTLRDSQGNETGKGEASVTRTGGFDLAVKLPTAMNLGPATLQFDVQGMGLPANYTYTHPFQVQEFRRPEFEVKAQASDRNSPDRKNRGTGGRWHRCARGGTWLLAQPALQLRAQSPRTSPLPGM